MLAYSGSQKEGRQGAKEGSIKLERRKRNANNRINNYGHGVEKYGKPWYTTSTSVWMSGNKCNKLV